MKNYKPSCERLNEMQVIILNNIGFHSQGNWNQIDPVTVNSMTIFKHYDIYGGSFCFKIGLNDYYFGEKHIMPYSKIESPYDSWWHDFWRIDKFMYDLDVIKENIINDIGALCAIGILKVDNTAYEDEAEEETEVEEE